MEKASDFSPININAPGSKSVSHRLLICAALGERTSRLGNVLGSADIECTAECLRSLGAITSGERMEGVVQVTGVSGNLYNPHSTPLEINVRESGTTCRLLAGVLSAGFGSFILHGEGRMHERPLYDLARALENQATKFYWLENPGCPPVRIESNGLWGGEVNISMDKSSQFLSGLLLAAPLSASALKINVTGERAVSWPYVGLTLQAMQNFGAKVEILQDGEPVTGVAQNLGVITPGRTSFRVQPCGYKSADAFAEGDFSSASYLLAAGVLGQIPVRVRGLLPDSLQGDRVIVDILREMGARLELDKNGHTAYPGSLQGMDVDMGDCPDLVPTVAVLASLAKGETRISGVGHLRHKESDRLSALEEELRTAGFQVRAEGDSLHIKGQSARPGRIQLKTHADHRMAMSLSLLELGGFEVHLDHPDCVEKSYPGFWEDFQKIKEHTKWAKK